MNYKPVFFYKAKGSNCVDKAKEALRLAERNRFEADKDLNQYVDKLEETNVALQERATFDKEK